MTLSPWILVVGFAFFVVCHGASPNYFFDPFGGDPNRGLGTLQIIRKYGYPAESHTVETSDGYLLELHRIPGGRQAKVDPNQLPVFLQHGLLGSSSDYVILGPNVSLPFILADMGMDVWLGNARGNFYSRAHVSIDPSDLKFWNYTWHETAVDDLPAEIDFILKTTNHKKLIHIGFSMGTTTLFILASTRPEYNQKIEASFLLAPIAYLKNIKSPLLRFLAPFSDEVVMIMSLFGDGEFLPKTRALPILGRIFCSGNIDFKVCMDVIFMITGNDPREYKKEVLEILYDHYPSGYSVKAINHYSQLTKSGEFRQYDYTPRLNQVVYGRPTPPDYPVGRISLPMYFYMGRNDYLSTIPDVHRLARQLPSLKKIFYIKYPKFGHVNFIVGETVRTDVYEELIKDMKNHLSGNIPARTQIVDAASPRRSRPHFSNVSPARPQFFPMMSQSPGVSVFSSATAMFNPMARTMAQTFG